MNPNWTGRSARTLDDCRFWDASPIDHGSRKERGAGIALAIVIGVVLALGAFHWLAR